MKEIQAEMLTSRVARSGGEKNGGRSSGRRVRRQSWMSIDGDAESAGGSYGLLSPWIL